MNTRLSIAVLTAAIAAMSLGNAAVAKEKDRGHHGHQQSRQQDRHVRDDDRRIRNYQPQPVWHQDDRRHDDRNRRYHPQSGKWDNGRRGPPSWAKGKDYRSYGYDRVIYVPYADYRRYDLYAPRDGYRWVRDDSGHYLLVSLASGIISDILYRHGL